MSLKKRLSLPVMDIDYKELEDSSMKLFKLRLELSKLYGQIDDFTDEEMTQHSFRKPKVFALQNLQR